MLNAKPNMNGNSAQSFKDVGRSVHSAALELESILCDVNEIVHGRNYQNVSNPNVSRDQDVKRLMAAMKAVKTIKDLAVDIYQSAEQFFR